MEIFGDFVILTFSWSVILSKNSAEDREAGVDGLDDEAAVDAVDAGDFGIVDEAELLLSISASNAVESGAISFSWASEFNRIFTVSGVWRQEIECFFILETFANLYDFLQKLQSTPLPFFV